MIGQIAPLVQGGTSRARAVAAHLLGGLLGGLGVGAAVGFLAEILRPAFALDVGRIAGIALLVVVGVLAGLADLGVPMVPVISSQRQTPKSWSCSLGPYGSLVAWGADLGTGVTTRVHGQVYWLLPVSLLVFGDFVSAVMVFVLYGVFRAGVTAVVSSFTSEATTESVLDFINVHNGRWLRAGGLMGVSMCVLYAVRIVQ